MVHETTELWVYCPTCGKKMIIQLRFKEDRVIEVRQICFTKIPLSAREKAEKLSEKLRNKDANRGRVPV